MTPANRLLTPKQLAEVIGASESSVRRWVDAGEITLSRTVGGHRRIPLAEAVQFIRKLGAPVLRPDLLGLDSFQPAGVGESSEDEERLFQFLTRGERTWVKDAVQSWYLAGRSMAAIFDGPLRGAMQRIGELWKHDAQGILIEHRATEICVEALLALETMIPERPASAPLGIGGAPERDPYQLPSMMASAVLAEVGFRTVNFGANTPVELFETEAIEKGASIVWISISASPEVRALSVRLRQLPDALREKRIELVLGGRAALDCAPRGEVQGVSVVSSMSELGAFARGIKIWKG